MSGISGAFDLAMNNPSGMVALVEAVEVYEVASQEYKTVHGKAAGSTTSGAGGGDTQKSSNHGASLRFTDMRAAALTQMYQDFEMRGLEVFREVHESVSKKKKVKPSPVWLSFCCCLWYVYLSNQPTIYLSFHHFYLMTDRRPRRRRRRSHQRQIQRHSPRLQWPHIGNFLCPESNGTLFSSTLGTRNTLVDLCCPSLLPADSRTNWWRRRTSIARLDRHSIVGFSRLGRKLSGND